MTDKKKKKKKTLCLPMRQIHTGMTSAFSKASAFAFRLVSNVSVHSGERYQMDAFSLKTIINVLDLFTVDTRPGSIEICVLKTETPRTK